MCAVSLLVNVLQQKYWMCLWWCAAYKVGLMDCWTVELLNCWTAELLKCWTAELLNCWIWYRARYYVGSSCCSTFASKFFLFYSVHIYCIPNTATVTLCRCLCWLYVRQSCHELRWAIIEALCAGVTVSDTPVTIRADRNMLQIYLKVCPVLCRSYVRGEEVYR